MTDHTTLPLASSLFHQLGISLYVHYPFCVRKCPYCDFASEPLKGSAKRDHVYISALILEFKRKVALLGNAKLVSVFIGGGTPSLCAVPELERLLDTIKPYLHPQAEVSIEVNPGTVDEAQFKELRRIGFNRVSLGVQSFDDLALKRLGRIHDSKAALDACTWACRYFDEVNFDIMHGLPRQDTDFALNDLRQALAFEPTHLSWYELTVEEGTSFGEHPPILPHEDILYEIEESGNEFLSSRDYINYEVSAYNKSDSHRCVHNLNYWLYGDYLGIGAAAHQKISRVKAETTKEQVLTRFIDPNWRQDPTCFVATTNFALDLLRSGHDVDCSQFFAKYNTTSPLSIYRSANPELYQDYLMQQVELASAENSAEASSFLLEAMSVGMPVELNAKNKNQDKMPLSNTTTGVEDSSIVSTEDSLGAGAASNGFDFVPEENLPDNFAKIAGSQVEIADIPFEYMLNRLRLINEPFELKDFNFRTGLPPTYIHDELVSLAKHELITLSDNYQDLYADQTISLTQDGKRLLNEVINTFLPSDEDEEV